MERDPWVRALVVLLVAAVSVHLLSVVWDLASRFSDIILLFFLAWLVSFLLTPLANLVMRIGIPRPVAAVLIYLGAIVVLVVGVILLIPVMITQLEQLSRLLPVYVRLVPGWLSDAQTWLLERGINVNLESFYDPSSLIFRAEQITTTIAQNAVGVAQGVATLIFRIIIVFVLSFYFMLDGPWIGERFIALCPRRYQRGVRFFFESVDRTFGAFVRGVMLQSVLYGLGTAVVMIIAQLPFVAPIAVFATVMMMIPFVGPVIALIPPIVLAYTLASFSTAVVVALALVIYQEIVFNVISPKIMGDAIGIHPLFVFAALLVGTQVAGLWGAVFGVPIAGVVYAMFLALYSRYREIPTKKTESQAEPIMNKGLFRRLADMTVGWLIRR